MENGPAITIRNLTFAFANGGAIFERFDWSVATGEMWAILGPSGCGKTSLLYLIAGLQQPAGGVVQAGGQAVPRPRARTGLILQAHGLLPWATVRENARLGLKVGHFYRNKGDQADPLRPYPPNLPLSVADDWLSRLEIDHLADSYPSQLSGGERQRVAIARTLAMQPDLLLMDEPFSALDVPIRESLQQLVIDLHAQLNITTVIVTHNVEEAAFLGRRTLVLHAPPNQKAVVVDNPLAGRRDCQSGAAYQELTARLRNLLFAKQTVQ